MTFSELDGMVSEALLLIDSPVSEIIFNQDVLLLSFFVAGKTRWLIIDVSARGPALLVGDERTPFLKKQVKPIYLYLKAHLKGEKLLSIKREKTYGRVVLLGFENLNIELHLTRSVRNIIIRKGSSQISLNKVKELDPVEDKKSTLKDRSPEELFSQWLENKSPKKKSYEDLNKKLAKERSKKQKGLDKMLERQAELDTAPWAQFAEYLNSNQTLDVPKEFAGYVDTALSLPENIALAFERAKAEARKLAGLKERIQEVKVELENLSLKSLSQKRVKKAPTLLKDAKGRTKTFNDGIAVYIGKSAKDNLKL